MKYYVVEVTKLPAKREQALRNLALTLKLTPNRAQHLLQRMPGVVSRPSSRDDAERVAARLSQAGFYVRLQVVDLPDNAPETPAPAPAAEHAHKPKPAAQPSARVARGTPPPHNTPQHSPSTTAGTQRSQPLGVLRTLIVETRSNVLGDMPTRRGRLRNKLVAMAIIPTLLAVAAALVVTWFTVRPALYAQLLESARNPAIAAAASLSTVLAGSESDEAQRYLRLQETIQISRQTFPRDSISFIIATDAEGNPLSAWFAGTESLVDDEALRVAVQQQAQQAVAQSPLSENPSTSLAIAGQRRRIEVVAQPLGSHEAVFGAVVVGISDAVVVQRVSAIVRNMLLFSLIPILLAILFALNRARALTDAMLYLAKQADAISLGQLDIPIDVRSNDELYDLGEALERLRVSMRLALERLRRRR